jgi:hypothetical protein
VGSSEGFICRRKSLYQNYLISKVKPDASNRYVSQVADFEGPEEDVAKDLPIKDCMSAKLSTFN